MSETLAFQEPNEIPLGGADVILDVFVFLRFLTVRFDCQSPEFGFDV